MGVAALILGIVSIIVGIIPFCGAVAFVPAVIGLILGIVDTVQKNKNGEKKGMSIAGIVLNALAVLFIAFWIFVFGAAIANADPNNVNAILNEVSSSLKNEYYTTYNY